MHPAAVAHLDNNSARKLERALFQLKAAINLLDEAGAPPEIASHADLARALLEARLTGRRDSPDQAA
jgi:hypothetical protein